MASRDGRNLLGLQRDILNWVVTCPWLAFTSSRPSRLCPKDGIPLRGVTPSRPSCIMQPTHRGQPPVLEQQSSGQEENHGIALYDGVPAQNDREGLMAAVAAGRGPLSRCLHRPHQCRFRPADNEQAPRHQRLYVWPWGGEFLFPLRG